MNILFEATFGKNVGFACHILERLTCVATEAKPRFSVRELWLTHLFDFSGKEDTMHFPRIRDIREDRDKTPKEISDLLYISQQQYSLYERGEREIPVSYLYKLAKFYGVSADFLLGLTDRIT